MELLEIIDAEALESKPAVLVLVYWVEALKDLVA